MLRLSLLGQRHWSGPVSLSISIHAHAPRLGACWGGGGVSNSNLPLFTVEPEASQCLLR